MNGLGELFREGMLTLGIAGGPLFLVLLVVGLCVGVFQAATQVNDPSIGFLSRLVAAGAVLWFSGGFMLERLSTFMSHVFTALAVR